MKITEVSVMTNRRVAVPQLGLQL